MGLSNSVKGRRILPVVVDEVAHGDPNRVVYTVPHLSDSGDEFEDITASRFANAVNRTARWIETHIGRGKNFEAVGYIGPHDLTYPILVLACNKTGYKALLVSPRNSLEGSMAVIDRTDCHIWVRPRRPIPMVNQILEKKQMEVLDIPDLEELLNPRPVAAYPFKKTWDEAYLDPFVVLHTSGSTGLPKPIVMPFGTVASGDAVSEIPLEPGEQITPSWKQSDYVFNPFPWFHAASLMVKLGLNFWLGSRIVTEPTNGIISVDTIDRVVSNLPVAVFFIPPSIVEELAKSPETLEKLKTSRYIITGGGALSPQLGDIVNDVVPVRNGYGSTEGGIWALVAPERDDWRYFKFPAQLGAELREVTPGLHELFFVRKPEYAKWQGLFYTFPELTEYSPKDLFTQHPTKPDRWLCVGRADDVIVLSNGEKVQPVDIESTIMSHPAVQSALVVGNRRFHPAVLIELRGATPESEAELEALKDKIYTEVVEKANASAPTHARIHRANMMMCVPGKPFLRTDKGTVRRPAMLKLYQQEIDEFYDKLEAEEAKLLSTDIDVSSPTTIATGLRTIIDKLLRKDLTDSDNLFEAGFDSLLVFQVLGSLRSVAEKHGKKNVTLAPTLIYSNPSIEKLAKAFYVALNPHVNGFENPQKAHIRLAQEILAKYTDDLPGVNRDTVIVTGTTGSLGSYILNALLAKPQVKRIYCFNRSADAEERQRKLFQSRGLAENWPAKKVQFLQADLSKPEFGLSEAKYAELLDEATKIIHGQWPVNFNWDLSSFEPHIRGVRHLVDFSLHSHHGTSIFFISSIGSITKWPDNEPVPEQPIRDLSIAGTQGYSTSKLMTEMLLEQAAQVAGVDCSICRVGQIAGPVGTGLKGEWNRQEWFPTIISTSKALRLLPSSLGSLDRLEWIPVDLLANIILELAGIGVPVSNKKSSSPSTTNGASKSDGYFDDDNEEEEDESGPRELKVSHAVNPRVAHWQDIAPVVLRVLPEGTRVVSWAEWVQALRNAGAASSASTARDIPGLKLLDFYESLEQSPEDAVRQAFNLETTMTRARSRTLRRLSPVSSEWMELWLRQWNF